MSESTVGVIPHPMYSDPMYTHAASIAPSEAQTMTQTLPEGFQPIETAPRDGTVIIVWDPKPSPEYGPDVHTAFWNPDLYVYGGWQATQDVDTDPFDIDPEGWKPAEATVTP